MEVKQSNDLKEIDQLCTCLRSYWAAPAFPQCCEWPLLHRDCKASSQLCFGAVQTDSCCGPIVPTLPENSAEPERDKGQGEMSESPKPPRHTQVLPDSGARWLERWSPTYCFVADSDYLPAMTDAWEENNVS